MKKTVNQNIMPVSAKIDSDDRLSIGGVAIDTLVQEFGSPLWVICQETIEQAAHALKAGLAHYPRSLPCYAGKAFLCTAMAKLVQEIGFGLDVVSDGELYTALTAGFDPSKIFFHGNNKSASELRYAIECGAKDKGRPGSSPRIIIDNFQDILRIDEIAQQLDTTVQVLVRIIPGIEIDTHEYIKTGHDASKFGIPLEQIDDAIQMIEDAPGLALIGLHAHIGSQAMDTQAYVDLVALMADLYRQYKEKYGKQMDHLDVGGGVGIAYIDSDQPINLTVWAKSIADAVIETFNNNQLALPELSIEPGRAIIGTAGITLYEIGNLKRLPQGTNYLSVDGGMADNPRPITYAAQYTCDIANRMSSRHSSKAEKWTVVGRYCESGDIIVQETSLEAYQGDTLCVFCTGAYNYSMSSNYNRTTKPACVLVKDGRAAVIIQRESLQDLVAHDRIPSWIATEAGKK